CARGTYDGYQAWFAYW
nr:immunoglobulin heavy chain junction region [Mus musculus]